MSRPIQTAVAAMALALITMAPLHTSAAEALRVVRDPFTGELRAPNAAEAAAFEKAEAQLRAANAGSKAGKPTGPVEIRYPNGTIETKLDEDTMMYSVVSSAADGSLTMECLPAKEAQKFVKSSKNSSVAKTGAKAVHAHE